jgi:hypothetical protein
MPRPKQVNALEVLTMSDLVDRISDKSGYTKNNVKTVLSTLREVVLSEVARGNAARWKNFGIFVPVIRYTRSKDLKRWRLDKTAIGMAFYPSKAVTKLKPEIDVDLLLERGEYDGSRHIYAQR